MLLRTSITFTYLKLCFSKPEDQFAGVRYFNWSENIMEGPLVQTIYERAQIHSQVCMQMLHTARYTNMMNFAKTSM